MSSSHINTVNNRNSLPPSLGLSVTASAVAYQQQLRSTNATVSTQSHAAAAAAAAAAATGINTDIIPAMGSDELYEKFDLMPLVLECINCLDQEAGVEAEAARMAASKFVERVRECKELINNLPGVEASEQEQEATLKDLERTLANKRAIADRYRLAIQSSSNADATSTHVHSNGNVNDNANANGSDAIVSVNSAIVSDTVMKTGSE
jgi:RNA polymerase II transcription mediator complex subunit 9